MIFVVVCVFSWQCTSLSTIHGKKIWRVFHRYNMVWTGTRVRKLCHNVKVYFSWTVPLKIIMDFWCLFSTQRFSRISHWNAFWWIDFEIIIASAALLKIQDSVNIKLLLVNSVNIYRQKKPTSLFFVVCTQNLKFKIIIAWLVESKQNKPHGNLFCCLSNGLSAFATRPKSPARPWRVIDTGLKS